MCLHPACDCRPIASTTNRRLGDNRGAKDGPTQVHISRAIYFVRPARFRTQFCVRPARFRPPMKVSFKPDVSTKHGLAAGGEVLACPCSPVNASPQVGVLLGGVTGGRVETSGLAGLESVPMNEAPTGSIDDRGDCLSFAGGTVLRTSMMAAKPSWRRVGCT